MYYDMRDKKKYHVIYSSGVSIVDFEHVNADWIAGENRKAFKEWAC